MLAEVAKVLMTTRPTQTSVLESLEECRRLGDEAFLEKYASGHQPLGHYLIHEDKHYPMKAVWAAAHRPAIQTRDFKTGKIAGLILTFIGVIIALLALWK